MSANPPLTPPAYDGVVTPGGPAQVRDLAGVTMTKVAVDSEMSNNCYLLECATTGHTALIDAAADPEVLLGLIAARELTTIITTHQHWDHHRALAAVKAAHPNAQVLAGEPDAAAITEQTGVPVERRLQHGDRIEIGAFELDAIALRGHTPGSVALHLAHQTGHLWTGDSLFPGGLGNTFGDGAAFEALHADVSTRIFAVYGDDTWFYPGHGADSTLGVERPHLAQWRARGW